MEIAAHQIAVLARQIVATLGGGAALKIAFEPGPIGGADTQCLQLGWHAIAIDIGVLLTGLIKLRVGVVGKLAGLLLGLLAGLLIALLRLLAGLIARQLLHGRLGEFLEGLGGLLGILGGLLRILRLGGFARVVESLGEILRIEDIALLLGSCLHVLKGLSEGLRGLFEGLRSLIDVVLRLLLGIARLAGCLL